MDKKMKEKREKIIQEFIDEVGMTRQEAEFSADVELGVLPTGDVIVVEPESAQNK